MKLSHNRIFIPGYYTLTDSTLNVIIKKKKNIKKKKKFRNRREYAPECFPLGFFFGFYFIFITGRWEKK